MTFPFFIAKRYFFAKKSRLVNIISRISLVSIAIGTAAIITVLSVFNGLDSLVKSMFNSFDPDFVIETVDKKSFDENSINAQSLKNIAGVDNVGRVVEENALVKYGEQQLIATIKGVDSEFKKMSAIRNSMYVGEYNLGNDANPMAVLGMGIYSSMGINNKNFNNYLSIYVPQRGKYLSANPMESFNSAHLLPSGGFSVVAEYDYKYILIPIAVAKTLMDYDKEISAYEVTIKPGYNPHKIKSKIEQLVGDKFRIKDRYEQQELLYKTFKSERLSIITILSFILVIATFNMIGSLMMLIYEKKKDIFILQSMGAEMSQIRQIFILEGFMISLFGGLLGLLIGSLFSWLQQVFGFIKLGGDNTNFVTDHYPVELQGSDFFLTLAIVLAIGVLSSLLPSLRLKKY